MSEDAPAFGARLRSFRQAARLSQQELAERAGLSIRMISDLERGRTRYPYRDSLARLAGALGLCDLDRAGLISLAGRRIAPATAGALKNRDITLVTGGPAVPRQLWPAGPASPAPERAVLPQMPGFCRHGDRVAKRARGDARSPSAAARER